MNENTQETKLQKLAKRKDFFVCAMIICSAVATVVLTMIVWGVGLISGKASMQYFFEWLKNFAIIMMGPALLCCLISLFYEDAALLGIYIFYGTMFVYYVLDKYVFASEAVLWIIAAIIASSVCVAGWLIQNKKQRK